MDVFDVIEKFIGENREDYDGLCSPDVCGCDYDDLAPCGEMRPDCILSYRVDEGLDSEYDFTMHQDKRPKQPGEESK